MAGVILLSIDKIKEAEENGKAYDIVIYSSYVMGNVFTFENDKEAIDEFIEIAEGMQKKMGSFFKYAELRKRTSLGDKTIVRFSGAE